MTKEKKSPFTQWFELQFGKRPSNKELAVLRDDVNLLERQLSNARRIVPEVERWELRRTASHYAWVTREKQE